VKTVVFDVSALSEEELRSADVFREPEAIKAAADAYKMIRQAAEVIKRGGLVAFPTETVYGIGADAFNEEAVGRVYEAKGRPSDNPMIVHIARASDVGLLAAELTPDVVKLADAFWPGPLTMVLPKSGGVPSRVTGGLDTVGVRLPDSPVAAALIKYAGTPIAAPSANLSGRPSPTKADHVLEDLDGKVDVILVGPDCRVGIESTVVDMTCAPPCVLRPGIVTKDHIEAILGTPVLVAGNKAEEESAPRSPGMKYRHYAPKAQMLVIEGAREKVRSELERLKSLNEKLGLCVVVMTFEEKDYLTAAHDFYAELRRLDEEGTDLILAGALSETDGLGFAVMNRMLKAAGYNIARV